MSARNWPARPHGSETVSPPEFRRRPAFVIVGVIVGLLQPLRAAGAPIDWFVRVPDAAISGHNVRHLADVSPEDCAKACVRATDFRCKSFDYYKNDRACDLSDESPADGGGLKTDYSGNPYDHYSRRGGGAKQ